MMNDFANLDLKRAERTGFPEVIYCAGKKPAHALSIFRAMREAGVPAFGTRASAELAAMVSEAFPESRWDELSRTLSVGELFSADERKGLVAVVCAGTSDLPVAREAALTAEFFGSRVVEIADVGVAGLHRLLNRLDEIRKARVVVAVAGMEGALPSVIAGLVAAPVIACPTSVGYGANFGGLSAMLGMLTACAPGISVVNIDSGFGAGYQANLINRL
jgi:NCAIR mutase (PurE)-related protein